MEKASFQEKCDAFRNSDPVIQNEKMMEKEEQEGRLRHCPECDAPVVKKGGCNAMVCASCKTGFCWLCGEKIVDAEGFPPHFSTWNKTSPCAGKQFEGYDGEEVGYVMTNNERSIELCLLCPLICLAIPFLCLWLVLFVGWCVIVGCLIQVIGGSLDLDEDGRPNMREGNHMVRCLLIGGMIVTMAICFSPVLIVALPFYMPWRCCYIRYRRQQWIREQAEEADAAATRGLIREEEAAADEEVAAAHENRASTEVTPLLQSIVTEP